MTDTGTFWGGTWGYLGGGVTAAQSGEQRRPSRCFIDAASPRTDGGGPLFSPHRKLLWGGTEGGVQCGLGGLQEGAEPPLKGLCPTPPQFTAVTDISPQLTLKKIKGREKRAGGIPPQGSGRGVLGCSAPQ